MPDLVAGERAYDAHVDSQAAASLPRSAFGDAGDLLDATAKAAHRRRLAEIDDDLDVARATGDTERAVQAGAERDHHVRELARAFGLSGGARRAASASERARASVTRAIRQAMARIGTHHPGLGEHLRRTVRTGTYCAYLPDPRAPAGWRLWWQSRPSREPDACDEADGATRLRAPTLRQPGSPRCGLSRSDPRHQPCLRPA